MQFDLSKEEDWSSDECYDESETDSDEKPPEEHSNSCFGDNKEKWVPSNHFTMKNHNMGLTNAEVMDFEREIKDMMESVRSLQTALSEDVRVGDIFKLEATEGQASGEATDDAESVKASIEEMEKMDAILRIKAAEERKAKLCRIQAEEESKDILSRLPCTRESNVIKLNLEEFMRLLDDLGETEGDSANPEALTQVDEAGDKEKNKDAGEKKGENKNGEERRAKHFKFIEKNIQLAKCGRGTLSLTDEEKQRIEELLVEAEESPGENQKEPKASHHSKNLAGTTKELYAIDEETKSVLLKIDQQLEAVVKTRGAERSGSKLSLLEKHTKEDVCEKGKEKGEKKKGNRLAEINKLLNAANSVIHEEITPLSEEEIERLLEESRRSLCEEESAGRKEGGEPAGGAAGVHCKGSEEMISELVENAKSLMPKFKFRFVDS